MKPYATEQKAAGKPRLCSATTVALAFAIAGVVLRLIWCVSLPDRFFWGDEDEYSAIASHLVDQGFYSMDGVHPTAYRAPGQVLLIASLYKFTGVNPLPVRMAQTLLWGLAVWLAYRVALEIRVSQRAALWAAAATALYPAYIYAAGVLFPMTLFTLVLLAGTLGLLRVYNGSGLGVAALTGGAMGFGTLTIPYLLPAVLLTPFWLGRTRWRASLVLVTVTLVVVAPWPLRNWKAMGTPVMGTQQWLNVWYGNNAAATATSGSNLFLQDKAQSDRYLTLMRDRKELDAEHLLRDEALQYMRDHPLRTGWLWVCKALNLYRFWPAPLTVNEHSGWIAKLLGALSFGPVLVLAMLGWWGKVFDRHRAGIVLIYLAVFTLVAAVTISKDRFRMPLDVYLLIFAAATVERWLAPKSGAGQ